MPTFRSLTEEEVKALRPAPPRDEYAEAILQRAQTGGGYLEITPDNGQAIRSIMSTMTRTAKRLGVVIRKVNTVDDTLVYYVEAKKED